METESQILERALSENEFDVAECERLRTLLDGLELGPWFETVDDSPFALGDWLEALLAFDRWLSEKGVTERPVDAMLGYLECCTLTVAETLSLPEFSPLVLSNLDQFGFDAALPAQT